jgi:HK97 family phage major capsid protein
MIKSKRDLTGKTKLELIDLRETIQAEIEEIIALAQSEEREVTEDELTQLDELNEKLNEVNTLIDEKDEALRKLAKRNKANFTIGKTEKRSTGLISMINDVLNHRQSDALLEVNERGNQLFKGSNLGTTGQIILPMEYRSPIQATVSTHGIEAVPEQKLDIVEALRQKSVLFQCGAQFYNNLTGDVSIPVMGGSNVAWAAENATASDGGSLFAEVVFKPLRLTAYVDVSKQFLLQSQSTAEGIIINDLGRAVMEKLEATLLGKVAGAATYPAGIGYTITPVDITPAWTEIVGLEETLYNAKVAGNITYLINPSMSAALQTTSKDSGSGQFIYQNGNINGRKVLSSGNVYTNGLILGDFTDYAICNWGSAFDLTIDPYSQAANGYVRIVVNSYWNGGPRRVSSFVTGELDV